MKLYGMHTQAVSSWTPTMLELARMHPELLRNRPANHELGDDTDAISMLMILHADVMQQQLSQSLFDCISMASQLD